MKKDLTSLSEFIRLYLSRNKRWPSPKFVAGESYGGFRAAALSQELTTDFGIGLNGIIMISPVLEFGLDARGRLPGHALGAARPLLCGRGH